MYSIQDRVALVTGGAGSIGLAIVKKLLDNGAKGVAILDVLEEAGSKAIKELNNPKNVIFIKTDVTVQSELEDAFETTVRTFKNLDIVINTAGIVNETQWEKTVNVNLVAVIKGTYLGLQKYLPQYKSSEEGVIVNIASILGLSSMQVAPIYSTTKHGLVGLGQALGGEEVYKKYKVRVLTLCPGLVNTPMTTMQQELWFSDLVQKEFSKANPIAQEPERVGEALIKVIARGKTGSLWVTEDDLPVYEIKIPDYKTMKV